MDEMIDIIRREAGLVMAQSQHELTLVATSYDPKAHAVKGIYVPHEVESGWVPLGALGTGAGYGTLVGPMCGSAEKLDGDQFAVTFQNGDPNWPIVKHRLFSSAQQPPEVQSGEVYASSVKKTHVYLKADGTAEILHQASGATVTIDKDGKITVDGKAQAVHVQASAGGSVNVSGSGGAPVNISSDTGAVEINSGSGINLNGPVSLTGAATLNGSPIATT